jgi:hypothetical protein
MSEKDMVKLCKVSFEVHSPRRPEILDLVHCHLCGPIKTRTIGGSAYFLSFVDDHSRKTWVYTLKSKNDVLSMFKKFKVSVERETGKKLKCIRIDNGRDFLRKIRVYCRENWIRYQRSLQFNGVAERMNGALVERINCLLLDGELLESFWGRSIEHNCACF